MENNGKMRKQDRGKIMGQRGTIVGENNGKKGYNWSKEKRWEKVEKWDKCEIMGQEEMVGQRR